MTPIMLWQLVIFAAYAFGFRAPLWAVSWLLATLLVRVLLMVWRAMREVREADAKAAAAKALKEQRHG